MALTLHHSFRSALQESFDAVRTSDARGDFYARHRREFKETDRDYAKKYDEGLITFNFVSRLVFILGTEC